MRLTFAAMTALVCACSSTTSSPPAPSLASAFVGSWARSGTLTVTCPTGAPIITTLGNDLVITLGSTTGTIVATTPDGCMDSFTVSGTVATEGGGQTCTTMNDAGVTEDFMQTTHTLTLSADEQSLTEAAAGTVVRTVAGKAATCMETSTGTFTKQ
jgi:hypothetical protein